MAKSFDQTGVVQVNGAWATRVKYAADVTGPNAGNVELRFMQGRAEVGRLSVPRDQLGDVLGEPNKAAIERHVANDADKYLSIVAGELRGRRLHYREVTLPAPDAVTPENSISLAPARAGERDQGNPSPKSSQGPSAKVESGARTSPEGSANKDSQNRASEGRQTAEPPTSDDRSADRATSPGVSKAAKPVPVEIAAKYLVKGNRYHFDDQTVAFIDKGSRLTAETENKAIIQDLVAIAKSREWQSVTVTGSQSFRRAAWKEATAAGLTVNGYRPTEIERLAVERERNRHRGPDLDTPPTRESVDASAPESAPNNPSKPNRATPSERGVTYGTLIAYGEAPYQNDPTKSSSYFVTLKDAVGRERTSWGVGLSDALRNAKTAPQINDEVGIRRVGATPVSVVSRSVDAQGEIVTRPVTAKRTQWIVEKADYFSQSTVSADASRQSNILGESTAVNETHNRTPRPQGARGMTGDQEAAAAIRSAETTREELQLKYPELNKAVFQHLASHDEFADAYVKAGLIRDTDRAQVIAQMRERLADRLDRGVPIKEPDNKEVNTLIRRSVNRVAADIGRKPIEIEPQPPGSVAARGSVVREDVQVRV